MSTDEDKAREYRDVLAFFCTFFAWFWGVAAFLNLFIMNSYYVPAFGDCKYRIDTSLCSDLFNMNNPEMLLIYAALISIIMLMMTAIFAALSALLKKP